MPKSNRAAQVAGFMAGDSTANGKKRRLSENKATVALDVLVSNHKESKFEDRLKQMQKALSSDDSLLDDLEAVIAKRQQQKVADRPEPLRRGIDNVWKVPHWLLKLVLPKLTTTCSQDVFENLNDKINNCKKLFTYASGGDPKYRLPFKEMEQADFIQWAIEIHESKGNRLKGLVFKNNEVDWNFTVGIYYLVPCRQNPTYIQWIVHRIDLTVAAIFPEYVILTAEVGVQWCIENNHCEQTAELTNSETGKTCKLQAWMAKAGKPLDSVDLNAVPEICSKTLSSGYNHASATSPSTVTISEEGASQEVDAATLAMKKAAIDPPNLLMPSKASMIASFQMPMPSKPSCQDTSQSPAALDTMEVEAAARGDIIHLESFTKQPPSQLVLPPMKAPMPVKLPVVS